MKTNHLKDFNDLARFIACHRKERIKQAGKHRCIRECIGSIRRLTSKGNKPLKKPVMLTRFYQCKLCGRDMK